VVGGVGVFVGALALFALQSLAVSLVLGRDSEDYAIHGWELFEREPLFPRLMLARTPVTGVLIDAFYAAGGAIGLEVGLGLLFAAAVTGWVAAARQWGRKPAVAMFVLLAVVPTYGLFFHRVSSDAVFAAVLALVAYLAVRMARRPSVACAFALGASVALLILTRPSGQPFLILALLPLGLVLPWARRARLSLMVAVAALVLVAGWAVSNQVRYGERTVAHGGKSGIPLYRVFVIDPRVETANGPATRAVVRAVQERLLPIEPYRSYGFDVDELLAARSVWVLDDIVNAVESEFGAERGSELLFRAGVEGVRAAPATYARGVGLAFTGLLLLPYSPGLAVRGDGGATAVITDTPMGTAGTTRRLPVGAAGQPSVWAQAMIKSWALESSARYHVRGGLEPVDDAIWPRLERRQLTWTSPADAARYEVLRTRLHGFVDDFSAGDRRPREARALRIAGLLLPAGGFWLLVAVAFCLRSRPAGIWAPALVALASVLVLLTTALAFPPHPDYALPFVPSFALLALAVLAGRSALRNEAYPRSP